MCGIIALRYNNDVNTSKHNENNDALRKKVNAIFNNQISRGIRGGGMCVKTTNKQGKVEFYRARDEDAKHLFNESQQKFSTLKKDDIVLLHHRYPTTNDNGKTTTHPFMNENKDISLIHNGTISNHEQLYEELTNKGHVFESQTEKGITDSEVILHEFEEGLEGKRTAKAITKSLERLHEKLEGMFAIAITMKGSNKIWLTKNYNPIIVYKDRYAFYASSEYPENHGFEKITTLNSGEIGYIDEKGYTKITEVIEEYHDRGIVDDSEVEGFGRYNNLNDEVERELAKERNELICYTQIPTIVDDMMEDATLIVHDSKKKTSKKARGTYLMREFDTLLNHYSEKLKDENLETERMFIKYEEHIEKLEEEIKRMKLEITEMEYDFAEKMADMGYYNYYEEIEEMRAYNEGFKKYY